MKILSDRLGFIRFYTWWNFKLPPLFGIAFLFTLLNKLPFEFATARYGVLLISMIGTAGFGHYLNDLADIKTDAFSGKSNSASNHTFLQRAFLIIILLILALLPWFFLSESETPRLLVSLVLLLFILYSLPPVRLKSKAFAGVITDMLYAHGIPSLIVAYAMMKGFETSNNSARMIITVCFWQAMVGLRNIAFHQVEDFEQDKVSGIKTWATKIGDGRVKKICLYLFHPLELIAYSAVIFFLFKTTILGGILLIDLIVWRLFIYLFIYEKNYLASLRNYFSFVNNSNEEDFPLVMLICLCLMNPFFVLVFILHLILFPEFFLRMIRL